MLTAIIHFEWRYYTRQLSFAAAILLFFGFGVALTATGFGAKNIHVNSPYSIFESLGLTSLASLFVLAVFCADAVVRDRERQMEELVFTTAIRKFDYLVGRFTGSFLAAFTAFSSCALGMLAALALPTHDAARIGSIHLGHYAWALLVMVLPSMLLAGVTLFAIATLTRSILATVVGAVFIYVLYFIASALTGSPLMAGAAPGANETPLASLLDPFAMSAFFEQTRYWTPLQRNTQLLSLSGHFLLNRLLWLAVTAVIWTIAYRRFSFRRMREQRAAASRVAVGHEQPATATTYRPSTISLDLHSRISALRSATRLELRSSITTLPFALLTLLWAALCTSEIIADVTGGEYGSALYPTTALVLQTIQQPFTLIATVILVYYAAEICWRERSIGIAEVLHATPASSATFVIAKWIALSATVVVLIVTALLTGVLVQLSRGYMHCEPLHMLAGAWFAATPLILFATAAVLIHAVAPQKYIGMFATLSLAVLLRRSSVIGLEHPLWRFSVGPEVPYSSMNGYGHFAAPFALYMLLWSGAGGLLLCAASIFWRRAASDRARGLATTLRGTRTPPMRGAIAALTLLSVATAAYIFYATDVRDTYESRGTLLDWKAAYEKSYRRYDKLPEPAVIAVVANVALHPSTRRCELRGNYTLRNDGSLPIARLLVTIRRDARVNALSLGGAKLASRDSRFNSYWLELARPLQHGETTSLLFDLAYENRGFADDDTAFAANGTYLPSQRLFPLLGYRRGYELSDTEERKARALPARRRDGDELTVHDEWISSDVNVTTDADQIAVAPGRLIETSMRDGRRTFHYRTDAPIHNVFSIASARYTSRVVFVDGIRIEILYDARHSMNVARIMRAAADSLRIFSRAFGPYPNRELRIVEVPAYSPFAGFANPGVVYLNEERAFLTDARDPARLDLITRRVAHEVAHQWWGHGVAPANVEGSAAITETLAKYSELLVLQERYGRDAIPQSLSHELDLYLSGRTGDEREEVPLARATTQPYIYYRKGAIVMNALRDLLGGPALHHALHNFYTAQNGPAHSATAGDLLAQLHAAATTPDQHARIDEWTRDVVLYDLTLLSATSKKLPNGQYDVALEIRAAKLRANQDGTPRSIPLHEAIELALFASEPADSHSLLSETRVQLHDGSNVVHVTVAGKPVIAVLDAWMTRLDRDRFDNEKKVE